MAGTTDSLPYIPAPHLISGSPLTDSQLITQFQDFRNTLRFVSTAPELVFERVVANLNEAFNAAHELERQKYASEIQMLQSSNNEFEKQVAELERTNQDLVQKLVERPGTCSCFSMPDVPKGQHAAAAPSPAVVAVRTRLYPRIGSFHTDKARQRSQVQSQRCAQISKSITFSHPYATPPSLPVGLLLLDIDSCGQVCVKTYTSSIYNDRFEINIKSWNNTKLYAASCSWLEVEANDPDFLFGSYKILSDNPSKQCQAHNTQKTTFQRPYDAPPTVVVWLTGLNMGPDKNWRVKAYATDVTATEFTVHIETWGDSILYFACAEWVAYTANLPGICSGHFSTQDLQSPPETYNSGYEKFGRNIFSSQPRTMLAIDSLDMDCGHALRLLVKATDISAAGMKWHLDAWEDTKVNSAGASYIALS